MARPHLSRPSTIATWNRNPADEEAMGAVHAPIWRRMVDVSVPRDLSGSTVLDYGCNQGGFLRLLYDSHPFKAAVGIDIARESVARAELLKGQRPITYKVADQAAALGQTFDFAFSHEGFQMFVKFNGVFAQRPFGSSSAPHVF